MVSRTIENRVAEGLSAIPDLTRNELVARWEAEYGRAPTKGLSRRLLEYGVAHQVQAKAFGELKPAIRRKLERMLADVEAGRDIGRQGAAAKAGTRLLREWQGVIHEVVIEAEGVRYKGERYPSLSAVAREITGTRWSGPRFFGLVGHAP
jgi:hypothetical protein